MILFTLVITAFVTALFILKYILPKSVKLDLPGCHVLVTGGSSGIGKALAGEAFKAGANVTLLARDIKKLNAAKGHLLQYCGGKYQNGVQLFTVDVSDDCKEVEDVIAKAQERFGPVDVLINSAGSSVAGRVEDIRIEDYKRVMDLNFFGSLYCTRAVIGGMKERRRGRVLFVSSQAGQVGLYGFSGYSASKFALRGFAEALQMEVGRYDVKVCVAYPPDTKTPGYNEEMKSKPLETHLISAESGLFEPEHVAGVILRGMLDGRFNVPVGVEGFFLSTLMSGMSPATHLSEAVVQILTMGLLRIVSLAYLFKFNRLVASCGKK